MEELLKLNDVFHTLQGEGVNAGRRALFVRLPFCNLKCSWCDTSFNSYQDWTREKFIQFATQEPNRFAVVTGGEPTMNKQTPKVIKILKELGFEIAVESNGNFAIPDGIDFVTISPKRDAEYQVHPHAWEKASEFKYVVDDGFDFTLLDRHDVKDGKRYSLSPEFGNLEKSIELILEYIAKNPTWRLSLQTHKWIKIP